jgi:hypothetical protein
MDRIENDQSTNSPLLRVFVAAGTRSLNIYLRRIEGLQTRRLLERIYEADEMGSGVYIPGFIKIGSAIQKLTWGLRNPSFILFKTKKAG